MIDDQCDHHYCPDCGRHYGPIGHNPDGSCKPFKAMTKPPAALELAREIVIAACGKGWEEAGADPAQTEQCVADYRAGKFDDSQMMSVALAALTAAQAERDAVIEDCAKVAEMADGFVLSDELMPLVGKGHYIAKVLRAMKTGGES